MGTLVANPAAAHGLDVRFEGCTEVWIVVNDPDEFGVLKEIGSAFDADAGRVVPVKVELTPENTQQIPDAFGDRPVFVARVEGDDAILVVETGDGNVFENPNGCPAEEREAAEEDEEAAEPTGEFAVRQGEERVPVAPPSFEDQSIEAFYGYAPDPSAEAPRQSHFPVPLEQVQTSRLFLNEDSDGLSLVFVHGGDDDPGGAASFETSGLDGDVQWLVEDDGYEGATDQFSVGDETAAADWAWGAEGRNDGGTLGYLGDDFDVSIAPRFNDEAELDPFDGEAAVVEQ